MAEAHRRRSPILAIASPLTLLLLLIAFTSPLPAHAAAPPAPSSLRTHYFPPNTIAYGIPTEKAQLVVSWINSAPEAFPRDITQLAYEVEVLDVHGQVAWASGRVTSDSQQVTVDQGE